MQPWSGVVSSLWITSDIEQHPPLINAPYLIESQQKSGGSATGSQWFEPNPCQTKMSRPYLFAGMKERHQSIAQGIK